MSATPYRPDIDGLRAVAVLAVVGYHAWPQLLPGGFVGVDVFFVISGFLITRILLAPGFSFASFYARRVRRIFPALLIVLAATLAIGATFLPPDNLRNLLAHTIGGGLFVANFVSYHDVGYFSGSSELKPLVHLWSLGVEEQFYLLWPVLVWLAARRRVLVPAMAAIAIVSFALFLWWSESNPRAAFYLSPSRFWELLAGAMLVRFAVPKRWAGVAAATGLGLIAASAALISSETEFPGALMLAPTLGACLVVASPGDHLAGRLLSSRGAVAIGLISYPLYLWHWPLLSLLRNFDRAPSPLAIGAALALSLMLAALTWRVVERPLAALRLRPVAVSLATSILAAVALTAVAYERVPSESNELANAACTARYPYQPDGLWFCRLSKDAAPTVLLLGDSHANHLYDGIAEIFPSEAVLAIGACMPTIGLVYPERADGKGPCFNDRFPVQSDYLQRQVIDVAPLRWVVVSALWRSFDDAGREIDSWSGKPLSTFGPVEGSALDAYVAGLERQLDRLGSVAVTIVLDTPRRGLGVELQRQRQAPFNRRVAELAKRRPNVQVLDPMPTLCGTTWCAWNQLRDANHLSHAGSVVVARALAAQAAALKAP
ncbi:MAG TPA: acyltransferase family protein [Caldimonas sp.]